MADLRLFVAAWVPAAAVAEATAAATPFLRHAGMRLVPAGSHHVTLRFLGEVPETDVGWIEAALAVATDEVPPGFARLHGLGKFPVRGPRGFALWAGILGGRPLLELSARLADLPGDGRPLQPHVTLARFTPPAPLKDLPGGAFGDPFPLDRVSLVRSDPGPDRPRYRTLREFLLGG